MSSSLNRKSPPLFPLSRVSSYYFTFTFCLFWDKVSLRSPGRPWGHSDPPASTSEWWEYSHEPLCLANFYIFETRSYCEVHAGLELTVLPRLALAQGITPALASWIKCVLVFTVNYMVTLNINKHLCLCVFFHVLVLLIPTRVQPESQKYCVFLL